VKVRATKPEKARMGIVKMIKCVACWGQPLVCGKTEVHHLNKFGRAGQKRRGHLYTIPLGEWHHQGIPLPGHTTCEMRMIYGPSLKLESKAFRATYGSDDFLLAKVNEKLALEVA
jgi:hypothetical protein